MATNIVTAPNILFLRGVFAGDLEEDDLFETKFTENLPETSESFIPKLTHYDSIPSVFTDWESWPKKTNLLCWRCSRNFITIPIFIVENLWFEESVRKISPKGNFCSDNCAQAYINNIYDSNTNIHDDKTKYLNLLRKERTGENLEIVKPSEEPTCMKQYCGESGCTSEEYGKKIELLANEYKLTRYKMEHMKSIT